VKLKAAPDRMALRKASLSVAESEPRSTTSGTAILLEVLGEVPHAPGPPGSPARCCGPAPRSPPPHAFRRTVATVVRNAHGPAHAQQQLSHAKLDTTEKHYLERQTTGPDVRATLEAFAAGGNVAGK
jgi:hypothetical protein